MLHYLRADGNNRLQHGLLGVFLCLFAMGHEANAATLTSYLGPDEATDLQVLDQLPAGFSYVAASMAGGVIRDDSSPTGTGLQWAINSLSSAASVTLTFQATVLAP